MTTALAPVEIESSFWARVEKTEQCWVWQGPKDQKGYGIATGRRAHRRAYIETIGAIPDGYQLDHLCRNRACVRPDHLEPVLPSVNSKRAVETREESRPCTVTPERFRELESVIQRGIHDFVAVADALLEVKEGRAFRLDGYRSFRAYCQERWGFSSRNAYHYLRAAEVAKSVKSVSHFELTYSEARTLVGAPEEIRQQIMEQAKDLPFGELAALVREARDELTERRALQPRALPGPRPMARIELARPARARLIVADVRAGLELLEPESVQTVVTSVPYWGLRSYGTDPQVWGGDAEHAHEWRETGYVGWNPGGRGGRSVETSTISHSAAARQGEKRPHGAGFGDFCECGAWRGELGTEPTPELYVEHLVEVFRAVWRVLRKDGTLWLNIGDSYAGSGKGPTGWSGVGDQAQRQGFTGEGKKYAGGRAAGVIGAPELGLLSRKSVSGQRGGAGPVAGVKPKSLVGIPWRVALALEADGWTWRSTIAWCKKAPMPESVDDRPTNAWEPVLFLSKGRSYFYDKDAVAEEAAESSQDRAYLGQRPISARHEEMQGLGIHGKSDSLRVYDRPTRNMRNVWLLGPEPFPGAHFAVFPTEIPRRCVLAGSRPGDVVLDPFAGAGTTLMVAARLGRDSVGIELKPDYAEMAADRIRTDGGFTVDVQIDAQEGRSA